MLVHTGADWAGWHTQPVSPLVRPILHHPPVPPKAWSSATTLYRPTRFETGTGTISTSVTGVRLLREYLFDQSRTIMPHLGRVVGLRCGGLAGKLDWESKKTTT